MKSRDPRRMKFHPQKVVPRRASRTTVSNGNPLHVISDRQLPVMAFGGILRAGSIYEPKGKTGLAALTAGAMRMGGSKRYPGDKLDELLDFMGAQLKIGTDDDSLWFEAWCLKRHFPAMLDIAADLIRNPAFPPEKVELARVRELETVRRRWDQPSSAANLLFRQTVYGKDSPWGKLGRVAEIRRITAADMAAYHRRHISPGCVILSAAGDADEKELTEGIDGAFGGWRRTEPVLPAVAPVKVSFPGGVYLVPREVGQANFRIGHLGIRLQNPDYCALRLMDMILGNSEISTRLFRDIRSERGLAYAIWSQMAARIAEVGTFHIGGETKYESLGEAISAALEHMEKLQREPAQKEEIQLAKNSLDNGYAFEFQSPADIAWRHAEYEYGGLPADWLEAERKRVLETGVRDVQKAARTHLHPEGSIILAVGNPKLCRKTLDRFGPVTLLKPPS